MNRRDFLKRAALAVAAGVAVDQLELLERLAPRRLWAGHDFGAPQRIGISGLHPSDRVAFIRNARTLAFATVTSVSPLTLSFGERLSIGGNDYIVAANPERPVRMLRAGTGRRL